MDVYMFVYFIHILNFMDICIMGIICTASFDGGVA